jgi:hypothetical protein
VLCCLALGFAAPAAHAADPPCGAAQLPLRFENSSKPGAPVSVRTQTAITPVFGDAPPGQTTQLDLESSGHAGRASVPAGATLTPRSGGPARMQVTNEDPRYDLQLVATRPGTLLVTYAWRQTTGPLDEGFCAATAVVGVAVVPLCSVTLPKPFPFVKHLTSQDVTANLTGCGKLASEPGQTPYTYDISIYYRPGRGRASLSSPRLHLVPRPAKDGSLQLFQQRTLNNGRTGGFRLGATAGDGTLRFGAGEDFGLLIVTRSAGKITSKVAVRAVRFGGGGFTRFKYLP